MDTRLVTVALATCNGEKFLRQQLESLIAQTYRPIEIVVCDDRSDDETIDIVNDFAERYPGAFRIYRNDERKGFIRNFERAISLAKGEFIAPCDQDDVWHPDKIEKLVKGIGSHSLIHSDARLIDERGNVMQESFSRFAKKRTGETSFLSFIKDNTVTGCTCLFRSDLLKTALPFWPKMPHDHWLALLAADGKGVAYTGERLIDYRQHSQNTSGAVRGARSQGIHAKSLRVFLENRGKQYHDALDSYREMYGFLSGRLSPRADRQFKSWLRYFESFFTNRIRIRAFCFHCAHVNVFSRKKRMDKKIFDAIMSLFGLGEKRNAE